MKPEIDSWWRQALRKAVEHVTAWYRRFHRYARDQIEAIGA